MSIPTSSDPAPVANQIPNSANHEIDKSNPTLLSGARTGLKEAGNLKSEICNAKPTVHSGARDVAEQAVKVEREKCKSNPMAHSGARADADPFDQLEHEKYKSNPMAHSGARIALTPRQLAALRLMARGHGSMTIAKRLGINRHTLPRWKKNAIFAAELSRMIERLTESALRLRAGSRMHQFSLYRAGVAEWPQKQENET